MTFSVISKYVCLLSRNVDSILLYFLHLIYFFMNQCLLILYCSICTDLSRGILLVVRGKWRVSSKLCKCCSNVVSCPKCDYCLLMYFVLDIWSFLHYCFHGSHKLVVELSTLSYQLESSRVIWDSWEILCDILMEISGN